MSPSNSAGVQLEPYVPPAGRPPAVTIPDAVHTDPLGTVWRFKCVGIVTGTLGPYRGASVRYAATGGGDLVAAQLAARAALPATFDGLNIGNVEVEPAGGERFAVVANYGPLASSKVGA